jgi:beta-alanine degradation protein BauB
VLLVHRQPGGTLAAPADPTSSGGRLTMSDQPTDHVGTELLFENDRLRVWSLVLEPGQEAPRHHHQHDYLFITTAPGRFTVLQDGADGDTSACDAGLVEYREVGPGLHHGLRNSGSSTYREIIVELKGPSRSPTTREPQDNGRYKE